MIASRARYLAVHFEYRTARNKHVPIRVGRCRKDFLHLTGFDAVWLQAALRAGREAGLSQPSPPARSINASSKSYERPGGHQAEEHVGGEAYPVSRHREPLENDGRHTVEVDQIDNQADHCATRVRRPRRLCNRYNRP